MPTCKSVQRQYHISLYPYLRSRCTGVTNLDNHLGCAKHQTCMQGDVFPYSGTYLQGGVHDKHVRHHQQKCSMDTWG